jgi:hypothetical protein
LANLARHQVHAHALLHHYAATVITTSQKPRSIQSVCPEPSTCDMRIKRVAAIEAPAKDVVEASPGEDERRVRQVRLFCGTDEGLGR